MPRQIVCQNPPKSVGVFRRFCFPAGAKAKTKRLERYLRQVGAKVKRRTCVSSKGRKFKCVYASKKGWKLLKLYKRGTDKSIRDYLEGLK